MHTPEGAAACYKHIRTDQLHRVPREPLRQSLPPPLNLPILAVPSHFAIP
jgi:hypothetical protein